MRVKGLRFLPYSVNFSDLSEGQANKLTEEMEDDSQIEDLDKEILLLKTMQGLTSDKERCVLLLEILREYGYQLDYESIAHALCINLRWFMRVKKNMKNKAAEITTNQRKEAWNGHYGV